MFLTTWTAMWMLTATHTISLSVSTGAAASAMSVQKSTAENKHDLTKIRQNGLHIETLLQYRGRVLYNNNYQYISLLKNFYLQPQASETTYVLPPTYMIGADSVSANLHA